MTVPAPTSAESFPVALGQLATALVIAYVLPLLSQCNNLHTCLDKAKPRTYYPSSYFQRAEAADEYIYSFAV